MAGLVGGLRGGTGTERAGHGRGRRRRGAAAGEPWFVRVRDYPGIGSALAWDRPVVLQPGDVLSRSFAIAIADGRLSQTEVTALADELQAPTSTGRLRTRAVAQLRDDHVDQFAVGAEAVGERVEHTGDGGHPIGRARPPRGPRRPRDP